MICGNGCLPPEREEEEKEKFSKLTSSQSHTHTGRTKEPRKELRLHNRPGTEETTAQGNVSRDVKEEFEVIFS